MACHAAVSLCLCLPFTGHHVLSAERKVFHSIPFHRKLPLYTALHQYPFLVQLFISGTVYNRRSLLRSNLEALVRGSAQNLTPTAGSDHPRLNDKYFKICFRIGSLARVARELFGIVLELYSHRLIWLEVGCPSHYHTLI
jgi:hypothetical protein